MEFWLLGPFEVREDDTPVALGGRKQRALLARLLLEPNRTVAVERLVDDLWGDDVPDTAVKMVQIYVSQLRKVLPAGARLLTRRPGYAIEIEREALDVERFRRLRDEGRAALDDGDAATAAGRLRGALALWRGSALAEFSEPFARSERAHLEELRLVCVEDRIDADLALGRHADLVGELEALTVREPLRERPRAQLMLALYRAGRQADALGAYQAFRRQIDEQLGIEPSHALKTLHQQILTQDRRLEVDAHERKASAAPSASGDRGAEGRPRDDAGEDPFVGRREELDRLGAMLDSALTGSARIAMLAGEPGIGKTRTAQQLASAAEARGAAVVWSRCHPYEGAPPYWPWVQVIRTLVRLDADGLGRDLERAAGDIARLVPELASGPAELEPPPLGNPKQDRFRLFDAVTAFLAAASQSEPRLIVIDDLHDADDDSVMLLEFIARELSTIRASLAIVGTYRDIELPRSHQLARTLAELARERHFDRIVLRGLRPQDTRRYVAVAGLPGPDEVAPTLQARTEGNPLFLREVVRLLLDERASGPDRGGRDVRIPDGVRDVIGERLRRLSSTCNEVLQLAAAIGREFSLAQLVLAHDRLAGEQVFPLVEEALDARIVEELPDAGGGLQFTHALFQEFILDALPVTRRAHLHARVARALEEAYGAGAADHAPELAHHFGEARAVLGTERFVHYSAIAGERALTSCAHEDALGFFERALAAKAETVDAEAARLLFGLGRAQLATHELHELDDALGNIQRAFDCYQRLGDVAAAVAVAAHPLPPNLMYEPAGVSRMIGRALEMVPEDSTDAARLLSVYGWLVGINHADHAAAQRAFDRALAIAHAADDRSLELQTLVNAQYVHMFHLRWADCLETGRRAAALAHAEGDARGQVAARGWAARALIARGELNAARSEASATQRDAEELGERYWLATSSLHDALVAAVAGDWEGARGFTDRGLAARPHDPRNLGVRAFVEYQSGEPERGGTFLERMRMVIEASPPPGPGADYPLAAAFLPLCDRIAGTSEHTAAASAIAKAVLALPRPTPYLTTCAHVGLGLIAVADGDAQGAASALAALEHREGAMVVLPPLSRDRILGLLAATAGDLERAIAYFARALEFCDRAHYGPERAWVAHEYAGLVSLRDDDDARRRAAALHEQALSTARDLGLAALLGQLGAIGTASAQSR